MHYRILHLSYSGILCEKKVYLGAFIFNEPDCTVDNKFNFRNMLRDLIPADLAKAQSTSEWKRIIVQHYNNDSGKREYSNKRDLLAFLYIL